MATFEPFCNSISFCSLTLTTTVFGITTWGRPAPEAAAAKRHSRGSRGRNMRVFLLKILRLSRRNWSRRPGPGQAEFRPPRGHRAKRNIQKPTLEHEQKRYREELPMDQRKPNEVTEIKGEYHL